MKEVFKLYTTKAGKNKNHMIEVSNFGNVKVDGALIDFSKRRPSRYHQVHLLYVHRMVAELFIPNPENKPFVDHIDTNPLNNHVTNLRWVTPYENLNNPITSERRHSYALTDEHKKHISEANKKYFSDPCNRILASLICKQKYIDHPELKQKCGPTKGTKKHLTDGYDTVFVEPEYWGEFIDIGFWFGRKKEIKK